MNASATAGATTLGVLACALGALTPGSLARAQSRAGAPDYPPERVQVRTDTVLRLVPRYELTLDPERPTVDARYYRQVDQLPVHQRVSLDARDLAHGHVDVHIQAHGVVEATLPDDHRVVAGDFALAYARASPWSGTALWGGRRFVAWGLPGGLHLDGVGLEQSSDTGLFADVVVGRPVTSVGVTPTVHSELETATVAYGARGGYRDPGRVSASVSYLERIAHGLVADRVVGVAVDARPAERIDLLGSASLDVRAGLEEARARVGYRIDDDIEPEVIYVHADPQKLLPSWSILGMFATEVYDEASLGVVTRVFDGVRARGELGVRRAYLPGDGPADEEGPADPSGDDVHVGLSAALSVHVRPAPYDRELVFELGHRDEGGQQLLLGRVGASVVAFHRLRLTPSVGLALDPAGRDAWLWRGAADLPVAERWAGAVVVDFARTPLSDGELRAMLRVSYQPGAGTEAW